MFKERKNQFGLIDLRWNSEVSPRIVTCEPKHGSLEAPAQPAFVCLKLAIETLEQSVKYDQS